MLGDVDVRVWTLQASVQTNFTWNPLEAKENRFYASKRFQVYA